MGFKQIDNKTIRKFRATKNMEKDGQREKYQKVCKNTIPMVK